MSLLDIFWKLFWNDYSNLNYNYYMEILPDLTEDEIKKLTNWIVIKKQLRVDWKSVYYRIALPRTQQNNWNISTFITITCGDKRMSYHWIFHQNNGDTKNYWVRKYEYLGKNDLWYDDFKSCWEECFKGNWWLYGGNIKASHK